MRGYIAPLTDRMDHHAGQSEGTSASQVRSMTAHLLQRFSEVEPQCPRTPIIICAEEVQPTKMQFQSESSPVDVCLLVRCACCSLLGITGSDTREQTEQNKKALSPYRSVRGRRTHHQPAPIPTRLPPQRSAVRQLCYAMLKMRMVNSRHNFFTTPGNPNETYDRTPFCHRSCAHEGGRG